MENRLDLEILGILLKGELSDSDISHRIYGGQGAAALPIMKLLSRMEKDGFVQKNGDRYVITDSGRKMLE